jgi:hypothetical protein
VRNPGGFLELESTTVVPLLQQWQTRKQQKFNAVKPEYLLYSDCRIYLIPDPIKLVGAAANDLLCMYVEHGNPCLPSGIRNLDGHDVSEGRRETITFGTK